MSGALPFALVSVAGTGIYVVILVALHCLPTGYSPIRHAVSDYGVGRYRRWFSVGLWSSSIGVLALAMGLGVALGSPPLADRDLVFLGLIALCRIGMSLFPTNLEAHRLTGTSLLHYAFAIAAFTFTYLAISHLTTPLKSITPWHSADQPMTLLAWLVAPALAAVVITMLPLLRRIFGLFERIFLITTNIWFLLVAILLAVKTS